MGSSGYSGEMVQKFFNRSPITLKFGAEKLERESQERESESESEQVVVFRFVSCCCSALVSCYSILVNFVIFTCKLLFYICNLSFCTCKLVEVLNSNSDILIYFRGHVCYIYIYFTCKL